MWLQDPEAIHFYAPIGSTFVIELRKQTKKKLGLAHQKVMFHTYHPFLFSQPSYKS